MAGQGTKTGGVIRRLAAWAVAYALVFQAVLTSAAIAALPRDGSLTVLCLNDPGANSSNTGGKTTPRGIHCPACLARVDLASPPAPMATPQVARTVVIVPFNPVLRSAFRTAPFRLPLQPRAPPRAV